MYFLIPIKIIFKQTAFCIALLFFSIALFSCDIVDTLIDDLTGNNDDENSDELLTSTTIGTDGGIISAEGLTVKIPAGTFSQSQNIDIYLSSVNDSIMDDIVTNVYSIDGIPEQYSNAIEINLKHNGSINEQCYLIVQEETYIPSLDQNSTSNSYFETVVVGDTIKSQLPAITNNLAKTSSPNEIEDDSVWKVHAVDKKKNHTTSENHFNIIYTSSIYTSHHDNEVDVVALGQYLEDAYGKIEALDFKYDRRTNWPIQVYIRNLAKNIDGYHCPSRWGLNSSTLEFNRLHLSKETPMKTTAIHEFFHFVQYLYDPRNFISRATFTAPHHWFNEASSVWSEELVTNPQYVSETKGVDTVKPPFVGLHAGSEIDASDHGYAMSAFVKYIVNKYGQNILVKIYDRIFTDEHVVDAIDNSINEMLFIEYNLFLQQYAHGQLYPDVGLPVLIDILEDEFIIASENDKEKIFTANYRELSGKVYRVKLDNPNIKDDTSLDISIDQELCHITVFQYPEPNNPYNVIVEGGNNCTVPDLKGLKGNNKQLLVMVTNGNLTTIPEYTPSNKDITLTMTVKEKTVEYELAAVALDISLNSVRGRYRRTDSNNNDWREFTTSDFWIHELNSGTYNSTGNFSNGVYTGSLDNLYEGVRTIDGTLKATLSDGNGYSDYYVSLELVATESATNNRWDGNAWGTYDGYVEWRQNYVPNEPSNWTEYVNITIPLVEWYTKNDESLYPSYNKVVEYKFEGDEVQSLVVTYLTHGEVTGQNGVVWDIEYLGHESDAWDRVSITLYYK